MVFFLLRAQLLHTWYTSNLHNHLHLTSRTYLLADKGNTIDFYAILNFWQFFCYHTPLKFSFLGGFATLRSSCNQEFGCTTPLNAQTGATGCRCILQHVIFWIWLFGLDHKHRQRRQPTGLRNQAARRRHLTATAP